MNESITLRDTLLEEVNASDRRYLHMVMIATKPDIIKQAPIYLELKRRGELVVLCHTGQHYDFNLSGGLQQEFGITPDVNLNISGLQHHKIAQIIERLGDVIMKFQSFGKVVIPYTHGDTTTSMAAANAAFACQCGIVHVEAGIRTLTPKREVYQRFIDEFRNGTFDFNAYRDAMRDQKNFERGSLEPYPEQFNTRCSEPASGCFLAPVELDREFLLSEGFPYDRIFVTGNSVADAMKQVEKQAEHSKIFEKYPMLEGGGFIRFCIHRRENTLSKKRFTILFDAISKLVKSGEKVLLISLNATETALDAFGLRPAINELVQNYPNLIYSPVWPYYSDVVAVMKRAALCATDSGSMQEEMNILGVPCVTLRFGSDRSETFFAGCNIPAPPVDSNMVVAIIRGAMHDSSFRNTDNIYGTDVSRKSIDHVLSILDYGGSIFRFEEERLGLS